MQQATSRQREQLERLTLLRDRILELLAVCRRLAHRPPSRPQGPSVPASNATQQAPRFPAATPKPLQRGPRQYKLPASAFVELSNWQEFEKFRRLPPISNKDIAACDIDELIRRLDASPGTGGVKA